MIHLTAMDGTPIAVNPSHIFAIIPQAGTSSHIVASGAGIVKVRESMAEIEDLVKGWGKDGE